jgi:hypothetical protein
MERILKSIDQLALMLAAKLKETQDHKPLDKIIRKLAKYGSTPPHLPKRKSLIRFAGHLKKKIRRCRPCMNEDFLSDWLITATMRESSFPHVRQ